MVTHDKRPSIEPDEINSPKGNRPFTTERTRPPSGGDNGGGGLGGFNFGGIGKWLLPVVIAVAISWFMVNSLGGTIETKMTDLGKAVSQMKATVDALPDAVSKQVSQANQGMNDKLTKLTDQINTLTGRVTDAEKSVGKLPPEVAGIKSTLDSNVASISANITSLSARIAALEAASSSGSGSSGGSSSGGLEFEINDINPSTSDVHIDSVSDNATMYVETTLYNNSTDDLRDIKLRMTFELSDAPDIISEPVASGSWEMYDWNEDAFVLQKRGITLKADKERDYDFSVVIRFASHDDINATYEASTEIVSSRVDS